MMTRGCACQLTDAVRTLYGRDGSVLGIAKMNNLLRLAKELALTKDDKEWLVAHMNFEENWILPRLSKDQRRRILLDHRKFKQLLARGELPKNEDLASHTVYENKVFKGLRFAAPRYE